MTYLPYDTLGWSNLMNGSVILAPLIVMDTVMNGWTISMLFFVYQLILYMKANNITLNFTTGIFFVSLYISALKITNYPIINESSIGFMFLLLVFELGIILYYSFWR